MYSLTIRLEISESDRAGLLETMRRYNEACNFVADNAYGIETIK